MTNRYACRTLQKSILTQHEAWKTRRSSEMGCQSKHMLHRNKAPGKDKRARGGQGSKGVNARHDKGDKQTDRQADRETDMEVWVREIRNSEVEGENGYERDRESVHERKEGTKGVRG